MFGPQILARTLSQPNITDKYGHQWQYHSRSDHHSKVACWGILFDLIASTPLLEKHIQAGAIRFGINHEMRDFVHDRTKNLDLVLCTPNGPNSPFVFSDLVKKYGIQLSDEERGILAKLPTLHSAPVGSVLLALEAKACMTAHQKALPRYYDELNSSHQTIHGESEQAIAVGFTMVNIASRYLSPDKNKPLQANAPNWSNHKQPKATLITVDKIRQLPRRSKVGETGYDALSIVVIDMINDGSPVTLTTGHPAPQHGDIHHYDTMIARLSTSYTTRFRDLT